MIDYHQWISNSIAALENAKANLRSKSRIDYYGEIKKLERQQRDVDKAIAQWKTIARLSHLFFDGNEVHLTFIPMKQEEENYYPRPASIRGEGGREMRSRTILISYIPRLAKHIRKHGRIKHGPSGITVGLLQRLFVRNQVC